MTTTTLCWCVEGRNSLPAVDVQYHNLTATEIEIRESQIERERTKIASSKWLINQRSYLENGLTKYPDNRAFANSASKGRNFNALFDKYFTGEDWEIFILRTLRLDIFILLCLLFVPTQFDEIYDKGLQDIFADEINRYLPIRSPTLVIDRWAAEKARSRINSANSEIDSESPEAKKLLQELEPYLSQTTRRSKKLPRPPATTLQSTIRSQSTTSETADTLSVGVDKPQRQWPNKEYAQNQHPLIPQSTRHILPPPSGYSILSPNTPNTNAPFHGIINGDPLPPSLHLSQPAPTAGYNGGHVQNWSISEQQFSQDLPQAPYLAASISPPPNNTKQIPKLTTAHKDVFINVSQNGFARKARKTREWTENEGNTLKRQRVNPLSQAAVWNDSARPIDSAPIWDGRSVEDRTGRFSTAHVSQISEPGQLPLATYSSGNNYSQITNYFPDFTQWEDVN